MRQVICLAFIASLLLASTYAYMTEAAHPPPEDESIIGTCPNIGPLIQINFEV